MHLAAEANSRVDPRDAAMMLEADAMAISTASVDCCQIGLLWFANINLSENIRSY